MVAVFLIFIAAANAVTDDHYEVGQEAQILQNLSTNFTNSENDFTNPRQNSAYFPFAKSREENERINRMNYTNINSEEYARKMTLKLKTWRGFQDHDSAALSYVNIFLETFSNLSPELRTSFLKSTLTADDLQKLPIGWQYLLPHQYYDGLDISGTRFAKMVNSSPGNTALLYKMAMVLRDESVALRDEFINSLNLPDQFREEMGYILGYRWGLEVEADSKEDFTMSTLLHLPTDVIMGIDQATFESLKLAEKLTNMHKWELASTQSKVAWYTKFAKHRGWQEIAGTPHHIMRHGHLMAGAPLDKLRQLKGQEGIESSLLADVLDRTDMNSLRVQEVWEALSDSEREDRFVSEASKLDVSQLMFHYQTTTHVKHQHKELLENEWLSEDKLRVPWVNMLGVGFTYMEQEEFASWSQEEMRGLGKFVAILSPAELDLIPASNFDSSMLSVILSPSLSLSQLTSIYKKYQETQSSSATTINPVLLSALPSSTITSSNPPFIWSQDKTNLLTASAIFSPAQMHSLHEITKAGHWSPGNLSTILSTHPQCMSDVHPREFRTKLDHVATAIYTAGPTNFHTVATKLQSLPRHLLMAWLEETHGRPGSKMDNDGWKSDVLLDRVSPVSIPDDSVTNPFPSHPLAAQFNRFTSANKSLLPSLALAGLSCHCINLVEIQDTLEVLALYRHHLESEGKIVAMPSSARKCWAKKVRQFLHLKAFLYNVTVTSELELLSLLSTSDIRTIGGEILLTWGGPALSSITHPEVMHEVLMSVGHTLPHLYLRNGVTYSCMVTMANTLLDTMVKEEGQVNLRVLTHVHNLVPYTDSRVLEATTEDIKLYISTVLRPSCKAICLKSKERELVRQLVLKAYGLPSTWLPLDLVELGDLLVVMARSDLAAVNPTSLRMASAQLSSATIYTTLLSEIRGNAKPVMYHEACGAWLGGKEGSRSNEALEFYNQWNVLANFIVMGSFLQVEVLENGLVLPKPRYHHDFRRRRQASLALDDDIDYKNVYTIIMEDMKAKFDAKELTDSQKMEATKVITDTQKMLGDTSFAVLGLERGERTQSEVLAVLAEYKDAGNMTEEQNSQVQKLAVDTQVRMIQELVGVLGLSATNLDVTEEQLEVIMARHTFVLKPPGDVQSDVNEDVLAVTELLVEALDTTPKSELAIDGKVAPENIQTTTENVNTVNSLDVDQAANEPAPSSSSAPPALSTTSTSSTSTSKSTSPNEPASSSSSSPPALSSTSTSSTSTSTSTSPVSSIASSSTSSSSTTSAPIDIVLNEEAVLDEFLSNTDLSDYIIFTAYEPATDHFTTLPSMDSVSLTCDVLIASGPSASSISSTHISTMSSKEVTNCLNTLGNIPWPQSVTKNIWKAVKSKVTSLQGASMHPIKREMMFQLKNLLPAIATFDSELLDMDRKNIDGISFLGRILQSSDSAVLNLTQLFITVNLITPSNPFTSTQAASLGQLLCGLREEQWRDLVTPDVFSSILTEHLSQLDCSVSNNTSIHLASLLTRVYGDTTTWTSSDLLSTGWLASTLGHEQLGQIKHHAMEGFTGHAVKHLTRQQLGSLSHHQLSNLSPHAASFISRDQLLPFTNMHRRRGIRAAGGEDEKLVDTMESIETDMQMIEMRDGMDGMSESDESGSSGVAASKSSSLQVLVTALVLMIVFGV